MMWSSPYCFTVTVHQILAELCPFVDSSFPGQGGHWSGKSQGDFSFLQGREKSGNFAKWTGNFKYLESQGKVREFPNFCPKLFDCGGYFIILSDIKPCILFSLASLARHYYILMFILENVCPKNFKTVCFLIE